MARQKKSEINKPVRFQYQKNKVRVQRNPDGTYQLRMDTTLGGYGMKCSSFEELQSDIFELADNNDIGAELNHRCYDKYHELGKNEVKGYLKVYNDGLRENFFGKGQFLLGVMGTIDSLAAEFHITNSEVGIL